MFLYEAEYQLALSLVKEAAQLFLPAFHSTKTIVTKLSSSDLVTETDQAIEQLLCKRIKQAFPEHLFIGEETVSAGVQCDYTDQPTWIIDPIDGTMNFVHRYPSTCIVIGFSVGKVMRFGVVYNPVLDLLYTGKQGYGAQCNGFTIHVSGQTELNQALVITEMGANRAPDVVRVITDNISALCAEPEACHGLRMAGSAALNICNVAEGSADAYYECGMHIWDLAAASVVLSEAGGVMMSPCEESFDLCKRRVVAASSERLAAVIKSKITHVEYPMD